MASKVCNAARASLVRILSRHPQRITIADLRPWDVAIYPRNGDTSKKIAAYIAGLSTNQFDKIATFFCAASHAHGLHAFAWCSLPARA
jgi:hypothetical protein